MKGLGKANSMFSGGKNAGNDDDDYITKH